MYTSKITQNNLLECIKEFIQRKIYEEVASQPYGPLLESKSTKLQILQTMSSLESFCDMCLRENQEKGYLNRLTVIVQLTKYYAIAFSKSLKSLLSVSKIADLRQWMKQQTCLEEIKDVQFFCRRKSSPCSLQLLCQSWPQSRTWKMFKSARNSRHVRSAETTWNIFQIFTKTISLIWGLCWTT